MSLYEQLGMFIGFALAAIAFTFLWTRYKGDEREAASNDTSRSDERSGGDR